MASFVTDGKSPGWAACKYRIEVNETLIKVKKWRISLMFACRVIGSS